MKLETKKFLYDIHRADLLVREFTLDQKLTDYTRDSMMRAAVVRKLRHQAQFPAHSLDIAAEGGNQQITALFEAGHVLLVDPELLGDPPDSASQSKTGEHQPTGLPAPHPPLGNASFPIPH